MAQNMTRDMTGSGGVTGNKPAAMSGGIQSWTSTHFTMMFIMWTIMMVAMMVPTALRSVLIFAMISQQKHRRGQPFVPAIWFVVGYVLAWTGFSAAATALQWLLDRAALLSPQLVLYSPVLGAFVLTLAGIWQMSPIKDACLKHCQSPMMFLVHNFQAGRGGAVTMGVHHGLYCLGCCWVLMGLLFVGGVMNLMWILAITLFVLAEKLLPPSILTPRLTGLTMILAGLTYLAIAS